jgi:nicotinamide riboside kinase
MTKILNLYGGPGTGKSSTAMALTAHLRILGKKVEYVDEFAKELVYENRIDILQGPSQDQLYILANQNRKIQRLVNNNIDWIITDSPLLTGLFYVNENYYPNNFKNLVFEIFNSYENINIVLSRSTEYQTWGRNHSLEEAIEIDRNILKMFEENNISYLNLSVDENIVKNIINNIF